MSMFSKKKPTIPVGTMMEAVKQENTGFIDIDLPKSPVKETPPEPVKAKAYSEEEIALLGDLERFETKCQGAFSKEEFTDVPESIKNLLYYEMLFSIWRELRELNETITNLNKEE